MPARWTCCKCGYVHWDGLEPISCIVCNHDVFVDSPDTYYKLKEEEKYNAKDKETTDNS